MAVERQTGGQRVARSRERVARPRNGRAAEIERVARGVAHDLHDVRIERLGGIVDRMAGGRDRRVGMRLEQRGHRAHQRRLEQRLVALHVDDDLVVGQAQRAAASASRSVPVGWSARVMQRGHAVRGDGVATRASSVATTTRAAPLALRALGDAHDHRLAGDVGERLAGQARRRVARGNEDGEAHRRRGLLGLFSAPRRRASSSSITGMPSRIG